MLFFIFKNIGFQFNPGCNFLSLLLILSSVSTFTAVAVFLDLYHYLNLFFAQMALVIVYHNIVPFASDLVHWHEYQRSCQSGTQCSSGEYLQVQTCWKLSLIMAFSHSQSWISTVWWGWLFCASRQCYDSSSSLSGQN